MTVTTRYNVGDKVLFYADRFNRVAVGLVNRISISTCKNRIINIVYHISYPHNERIVYDIIEEKAIRVKM